MSKWKYIMRQVLFLSAIALLAGTLAVLSQENNEKSLVMRIPCTDSTSAINTFRKANERLYFVADTLIQEAVDNKVYKAGIYLWMNLETGTGSFAIMFPDLTTCLLAPAQNLVPWNGGQPWDAPKPKGKGS